MIYDVTEQDFMERVVERSRELPVVVDFWAEWCGPCRQLGPALESAVRAREGEVELAKVDTDSNQQLAAAFGIRGIPAVKAFRDGKIVAEFTGAIPPAQIHKFLEQLAPSASEADVLAASSDEADLRRALELDPAHVQAAVNLARLLLKRGRPDDAAQTLVAFTELDFLAAGLAERARLEASEELAPELFRAFTAWDEADHATALDQLQEAFAEADGEERDRIRRIMIAIFTELGPDSELARDHRRRLTFAA